MLPNSRMFWKVRPTLAYLRDAEAVHPLEQVFPPVLAGSRRCARPSACRSR
jgi:hypothetical protein